MAILLCVPLSGREFMSSYVYFCFYAPQKPLLWCVRTEQDSLGHYVPVRRERKRKLKQNKKRVMEVKKSVKKD